MKLNSLLIEQIKDLCVDANVPYWQVLPEVKGFYSSVPEYKTYPREIKSTAKDIIARIKGEAGSSEAQRRNERAYNIHVNRNHGE